MAEEKEAQQTDIQSETTNLTPETQAPAAAPVETPATAEPAAAPAEQPVAAQPAAAPVEQSAAVQPAAAPVTPASETEAPQQPVQPAAAPQPQMPGDQTDNQAAGATPQQPGAQSVQATPMPPTSPAATVNGTNGGYPSLIFGILGIVASFIVSALIGLILGIIAVVLGNKDLKKYGTCGKAKIGRILGIIAIVLSAITWVISFVFAMSML